MTRAIPFGSYARNEREGGGRWEPGVQCWQCHSPQSLMVVARDRYHCYGVCTALRPLRLRVRKQVYSRG